jgi:uncharacterized surface protein with fasciclin (FAS1) repeats
MVSIGPNSQSNNFTHMFDFVDLRGKPVAKIQDKNSLMSIINETPDFSKFKYIVEKAMMSDILGSMQTNLTLFIPSDSKITNLGKYFFDDMDVNLARSIIKISILNKQIPSELLEDSPFSFFNTNNPFNKLLISNINGETFINNNIKIIYKDIIATNGIIHVIDNLILPEYHI